MREQRSSKVEQVIKQAIDRRVALSHYLKVQGEFVVDQLLFVIPASSKAEAAPKRRPSLSVNKLPTNSQSLNGIMIKKEFVLSLRFLPAFFYLSDKLVWEPKLSK